MPGDLVAHKLPAEKARLRLRGAILKVINTGGGDIVIPDGMSDEHAVRITIEIVRARTLERLAPLAVATIFILAACFLIAFAQQGEGSTVIVVVAASLFVVGLGLGGFSYARLVLPGFDLNVSSQAPMPTSQTGPTNGKR